MDRESAVEAIRAALPETIAIYLFGSSARGEASAASDIDLALLARHPLDPAARFELQERIASLQGQDVDLVDLRAASSVMRVRVLADAQLLYESDRAARQRFEAFALADYARLNEERRGILDDARRNGTILG